MVADLSPPGRQDVINPKIHGLHWQPMHLYMSYLPCVVELNCSLRWHLTGNELSVLYTFSRRNSFYTNSAHGNAIPVISGYNLRASIEMCVVKPEPL